MANALLEMSVFERDYIRFEAVEIILQAWINVSVGTIFQGYNYWFQ